MFAACGLAADASTGKMPSGKGRPVAFSAIPLRFEPNRGQARNDVCYVGRAAGYKVGLEEQAITFSVPARATRSGSHDVTVPMSLVGSRPHPEIAPFGELQGKSDYFPGPDRRSWITNLPNFSGVHYRNVYPQTDLIFHGDANRLEYDFHVAPGGAPEKIAWRLSPSIDVQLRDGDLVLESDGVELRFLKPVAFQEVSGGKRPVSSGYRLERDARGTLVKFDVGAYDRTRALVIDPVLVYSTQFSGLYTISAMTSDASGNVFVATNNGALEVVKLAADGQTLPYNVTIGTSSATAASMAVDASGQLYIAGHANAGYATTANAYQPTSGSGSHGFLTILNATGSGLVYSTYLQGTSTDAATGVGLDPNGKVLVSGYTYSNDFPNTNNVTPTGYQTSFVVKIDPTLSGNASLIYSALFPSTYYSGYAVGVQSDSAGNAYSAISSYFMSTTAGAFNYDGIYNSDGGAYVVKIDPTGVTQFIAYIGYGVPGDIAVDSAGNSYITGYVQNEDFPTTVGAYQTNYPDGFVTKLNPTGTALVYSTFLGSPTGQFSYYTPVLPTSIALPAGCTDNCTPYVSGYTFVSDLPTVNAIQSTFGGSSDAFIATLSADGASANFLTYFGGSSDEDVASTTGLHVPSIALDASGNMYVAGNSYSTNDFPYTAPGTGTYSFLAKISPSAGATIIPSPTGLSFGSQTMTVGSAPKNVILRNLGSIAATISSITSNNGAFVQANDCTGTIPAGASCTMQVTFTPSTPGTTTGTISIVHDGTNSPTTVALTGAGVDRALLSTNAPATYDFGGQALNTASSPFNITITNIGTQPAQIYQISVGGGHPEFVASTNCPAYLAVGSSCSAQVTFTPYTAGLFTSYVQISSAPSVVPANYVNLRGTGIGVGTASVTPSTTLLNFLDQTVGTTSYGQYVTIANTGTAPVTMGPESVTGDFKIEYDSCLAVSVPPGSSCYVYVQFAPTVAGAATGSLIIKNTAGPDVVVSLTGNGTSSTGQLVFSPTAVVFADTVVGTQSATSVIQVTNNANATVSFSRVYDTGSADFRITSDGCSVIGPYGTCNVYVEFTPTATGPLTGTITFIDTAAGSPHTVTVSGNGVASTASVTASPSAATFDDTVVGSSSQTLPFYLFNPGNTAVSASTPVSSLADFVVTYNGCSTIPAGSYCQINVQFRPQSAGARSGTLTIAHSVAGSPVVISLSGTGLATSESLVASALTMGFPDTVVGTTSAYELVYFNNPGNTNVTVSNVAVSGDFVIYSNGCSSTVYAGSYCYVYLQFSPTAAGSRSGTLTIFDDAPGSPHTVSLNGNGVNAVTALVATPSALGFDDQVVGTTSSVSYVLLYNPGNLAITVSNISVSGDFASTGGCGTISAGSYCYLPVTFTPTAAGQRTGTVTLTDTATGSPHGISLYGNGVAASTTVAVTPAALDFGNVVTGVGATGQTVYVTNTGSTAVTISSVVASSPFTVSGCVTTLQPAGYCSMTVSLTAATTGSISGTLTVTDTATGSPHTVTLAANGVSSTPAISVTPNGLTFPQTLVGVASTAANVTFRNNSGATVTIAGVAPTGDFAINSNSCTSVTNGGNCSVSVKFTPSAAGNRTGTLVYTHDGPGGSTTINLAGYGQPSTSAVQLSAAAIAFPDQVVGTSSSSQTVYVYNNGTTTLTMGSSTITSGFNITGNACTSTVAAASYCYVNVNFQPSAAGAATGSLTINASDAGSPHVVQLSANGVSPTKTLALSMSAVQFSDQTVGYSSNSQTLTVYNTGNSPVTFTTPTISGDYAITYNSCSTVSAGNVCYININFTPTASGTRTGTLTLNDDAIDTPQGVSLTGNGVTASKTYALTATALSFSDAPLNVQASTQYSVLYNTGTAPLVLSGTTVSGDYAVSYNGCSAQTLQPGGACTVGILFQPTATGARTGSASIGTDAPAGAAVIALTGNGVNQSLTARLSATSLTFADQAVGTTSGNQQLIYLYNTGNVGLPVSNVVATGDYSITYNGCGGTIAVNSYCYVYVAFTPTVAGTRTGSITFTDGSTTSPHVVSLTGNGVPPSLRININPGSLLFGPTVTGATSSYAEITVTNTGNAPVLFSASAISGDFILYYSSCEGAQLAIGGYTCYIDVQFKPTATGTRTGTLTINSNAAGSPYSVALTGTGADPNNSVVLSQNSITFASQPTNTTSATVPVYLVNQGTTPVTTSTVTPAGDFAVNSGCTSTSIGAGGSCVMYITFTPTATGIRSGSVTVVDNATGSPRVISLSGTGVTPFPVVTLIPNNLVFGNTNIGSTSGGQTITVYNTGSAPLNVSGISGSTAEFIVNNGCTSAVAVNSYCLISVQFAPTGSTGARNITLQLSDDAPTSPQSIAISANATGAGPITSLSTNALNFSAQAIATTSSAQTVTVTNTGNSNLTVSTPTITGPFAISANTCIPTAPVAPLASCSISVTFTPTAAGLTSGTLSIPDTAPGSPHIVGLSGTGVSGPNLTITPSNLVFNSQQLNTTSTAQNVTITNTGATATFSLISASGSGFAQTNNCTTLGTGASCTIAVTFTPTSVGAQTGSLSITDDAAGSPQTVALSGTGVGQSAVTLSSTSLDFGSVNVGSTSTAQTVTLSNTGAGPLAIASILATGDYSVTNNCGNNLSVGANCTLTITFHPTGANTRAGAINITDNAPASPQAIALTGVGVGAVATLSQTSLTFATQTVGTTSAAQTVTVTNTGNATLNITSIYSTNPQFGQTNDCTSTLAATASCTISVTFGPTAAGSQNGDVYVVTDVSSPYVSLSGSGTGPVGTVTPTSLSFGSVAINTPSATQTVTVSSTGTTALTISGVTISGDYSQTNNCPASLAVGSNCAIQVTFTPVAAGTRNGSLFINDNGSFSGHTVGLIGSGLGPLISLNPSSLTFGTVALNTTTTPQAVVVTNTGTTTITGLAIGAASGDFAQTNNCPSSLAVNATCSISVTFTPTVAGPRSGSLTVTSNAASQSVTFSGAGSGPLVQLNPPSLNFGNVVQNTASTAQSITLTNAGNATLNISSIAANGDFAETNNCPAALGAGSLCTLSVTFTPTVLGADTGALTIVDDAGGSPHVVPLSGTGIVPQEDLVITGVASPASIPPGGNTTYTFTITNNGPSVATSVSFTASLPTNALVTSATASTGSCITGASITCSLANMPVNSTATVTIAATATANAVLSTTASISAAEPDPNSSNNQVTVSATVAVADLVVTSSGQAASSPTYQVSVSNNGPAPASNVAVTCVTDRFVYGTASSSQGSCTQNGQTLTCSLGSMAANVTANISLQVHAPSTGWASISCHATATEFDPNPVNSSTQITTDGATNTTPGDEVGVQLYDNKSGASARVLFPSVKQGGTTTLTSVAGATPPAGFRNGSSPWTYDVTTTATTVGSPVVAFAVTPTQFHHPASVRLFHLENGAWVDRTVASDPSTSTVAAITATLSPFALFEPINHVPVANAGADRVIAGTSVLGATIALDATGSSDLDGDTLAYRWSGPFTEGNGVATGARPNLTLPFGASRLTLVANDGETDSAPVTVNVTVADFGVALSNASPSVVRGSSTSLPVTINAIGGAFDAPVTLGCANVPAGVTCSFSPATVQPGVNGAMSTLTISSTATAANRHQPAPWTFGTLMFGAAGVVLIGGRRRRQVLLLTLALLAIVLLVQVGCGGGNLSASSNQPASNPATTVTITVTGNSAGLQHSATMNVTLK